MGRPGRRRRAAVLAAAWSGGAAALLERVALIKFSAAAHSQYASAAPPSRFLYEAMRDDAARTGAYARAVASEDRGVRGKVVLDIGAGSLAVLTLLCLRAGARHVFAVEVNAEARRRCEEAVRARGFGPDRCTVLQGHSVHDLGGLPPLPGEARPARVDVVVSELVGNLATAEGAAWILRDARARFVDPAVRARWSVPFAAATFALPVALPPAWRRAFQDDADRLQRAIEDADPDTLAALFLLRPELATSRRKHLFKLPAPTFPLHLALADSPKCAEFLDLDGPRVADAARHTALWGSGTTFGGQLDAFLLFNALSCTRHFDVTSFNDPESNWQPLLLVLDEPRILAPDDTLALRATADLATAKPTYTWEVTVARAAEDHPWAEDAAADRAPPPPAEWRRAILDAAEAAAP